MTAYKNSPENRTPTGFRGKGYNIIFSHFKVLSLSVNTTPNIAEPRHLLTHAGHENSTLI